MVEGWSKEEGLIKRFGSWLLEGNETLSKGRDVAIHCHAFCLKEIVCSVMPRRSRSLRIAACERCRNGGVRNEVIVA